ncbi:hypothetical protein MUU72_00740 [Streptomyces sp. RS10V-4]|uniref:hypothetical protein n=1 Tax=Streptomyces rhizoryzae TaxID=2932493 RepID=UPI0020033103|nr:hypothetical protein [Streptomyces rhizoryzae]MCK7621670.1 hypothetical protein [Streptomyces rhizoryzae]
MISKGRHQDGDVAAALDRARSAGCQVVPDKNGHRWGWVVCCSCGARHVVSGTPKNPGNEAKRIDRFVRDHQH